MYDQDGLGETHATCRKKDSRQTKNLESLSEYSSLVQFEARSTTRTAILSNNVGHSQTACRVKKAIFMKTKD